MRLKAALLTVELVFHEETPVSKSCEFVGIEIDLHLLELKNTWRRVWRLYKAIRCLLRLGRCTSKIMQVVVGHIVHMLSLVPAALSVIARVYDFIEAGHRDTF